MACWQWQMNGCRQTARAHRPDKQGDGMYQKPRLVRYGTFRDLTLLGIYGDYDGISVWGNDGCYGKVFGEPCSTEGGGS